MKTIVSPKSFTASTIRYTWMALLFVSILLLLIPTPAAMADGGGPDDAGTATVKPTFTEAPGGGLTTTDGIENTLPDTTPQATPGSVSDTPSTAVADTTKKESSGGLPIFPLALLLLAMLAFGAIAFLLFRKK